jgi:repressor LexA
MYDLTDAAGSISRQTLYPRQKEVLAFIEQYIAENGYAPTLTMIQEHLGVNSLSTVHEHLIKLEDRGFLKRSDRGRKIELMLTSGSFAGSVINVPLVGLITAGQPIDAIEESGEFLSLPSELVGNKKVYCLRVRGDSMIEEFIVNGDVVIVEKINHANKGDTIVALLDDGSATLKRYYPGKRYVMLKPANEKYKPIKAQNVTILGRVIGVFRRQFYKEPSRRI